MSWDYSDAEEYVLDLEQFGMRFGLDRIEALLIELGRPQDAFESIHVVGSNGKSSTVRMGAALAKQHGLRAGAYLSPHLRGFYERIRIDDADVSPEQFASAVERVAAASRRIEQGRSKDDLVTQFETLTAAAFLILADAGVELTVLEAGLGGRFDATNVLARSRVQVLTNVALEHTRWLGSTIAEIAFEKVSVVKPQATLVVGAGTDAAALAVARDICAERDARIVIAPPDSGFELHATGAYQRSNFALAVTALREQLPELGDDAIARAAATIEVPGRFEIRRDADGGSLVILDGAHNPAGVQRLSEALIADYSDTRVVGVISILDDKDAAAMLSTLAGPLDEVICTKCSSPRSLEPQAIAGMARRIGLRANVERDPKAAMRRARELAGADGVAVATGSLYLLADLGRDADAGRVSTL
ncbi:MAG TPA: cyanophycin synthetase [Baekduia sp.]|nr:cyanophycin synthetase [Baekduia sp.]